VKPRANFNKPFPQGAAFRAQETIPLPSPKGGEEFPKGKRFLTTLGVKTMNATTTQIADCTLYAQPYNINATGFYFTSPEEYEQKAEGLTDRYGCPVEEFEIQLIDGDDAAL